MAVKNSVDLEQDPRSIIGKRVLDAPRALVFSMWTDPEHLAQWSGPNGFTTTTRTFDFRPGGVWRFVMHGPDGRDYQNRITLDEITPPERIVYRHDGSLIGAPHFKDDRLDKPTLGLKPVRVTEWHGWVFVDRSGQDQDFAAHIGELEGIVAEQHHGLLPLFGHQQRQRQQHGSQCQQHRQDAREH